MRQGVKYHNGQEVKAQDVEFSFKRIGEKHTVWSSRVANIESYEVIDDYTIQLTLNAPQADFLDGLVFLSIVPQEVEAELGKNPVGSGPFRFVEWIPNDRITLERYPDYWEPDLAKIDRLTFQIIPESQVAVANLQSGSINGILDIPVAQAVFFKDSDDVKAIIQPTSSFHLFEMLGQNSQPIRTDARVRQALWHIAWTRIQSKRRSSPEKVGRSGALYLMVPGPIRSKRAFPMIPTRPKPYYKKPV